MSDSVRPHRRQPTRLPHPWDSPGKNTGVGCHFLLQCIKVKSESEVTQSCQTLHDPMDCSPPGSSSRGIFQARELEWGAIAFSEPPSYRLYSRFFGFIMLHPPASLSLLELGSFFSSWPWNIGLHPQLSAWPSSLTVLFLHVTHSIPWPFSIIYMFLALNHLYSTLLFSLNLN